MALLFFGTDPNSGGGNCPAVWVDTDIAQGPELVLQGKFADAATRATCSQDSLPADDELDFVAGRDLGVGGSMRRLLPRRG
jgi:hypothetical protein